MKDHLNSLLINAKKAIESASDLKTLDDLRTQYFGKKGEITELLKSVSQLPAAERPEMGRIVNVMKQDLQSLLTQKAEALKEQSLNERLAAESIDITLPGRGSGMGSQHPVTRVRERLECLLRSIGFEVFEGPEI